MIKAFGEGLGDCVTDSCHSRKRTGWVAVGNWFVCRLPFAVCAFLNTKRYSVLFLCLLFLPLLSCAYYSTSATGSGGMRTVAIPLLENESLEANIHQALTDSLIQGFVTDGALRVVDEDLADAVLQGTIVEVKEDPFTYGERADQYQIAIFVKIVFYDTREKKAIWEAERMRGYGIYSASGVRESNRQEGLNAAMQMLTRDVVDRTQVGGW